MRAGMSRGTGQADARQHRSLLNTNLVNTQLLLCVNLDRGNTSVDHQLLDHTEWHNPCARSLGGVPHTSALLKSGVAWFVVFETCSRACVVRSFL